MTDELYDLLLMDYASGGLDETLSLLVASHLSLSRRAQAQAALLDNLGGALLQECCGQVAMRANALNAVLDRLTEEEKPRPPSPLRDFGCRLPGPLHHHLGTCRDRNWKRATETMSLLDVPVPRCAERKLSYRAFIVRAAPGATVYPPSASRSYVLILEGTLHLQGNIFSAGDLLIFTDDGHELSADNREGCTCLIIREDVSIFQWLRRLLNV